MSFDCANRSLAVCCVDIDATAMREEDFTKFATGIKILFVDLFDLTKGEKLDTIQRAIALRDQLRIIDARIPTDLPLDHVLIEYQMSANDKSRCQSQQLVYHYLCKFPGAKVHLVKPGLKNKLAFAPHLTYAVFAERYKTRKTANKNHSRDNFLYLLDTIGARGLVKGFKKLDDMADSVNQVVGWIRFDKSSPKFVAVGV